MKLADVCLGHSGKWCNAYSEMEIASSSPKCFPWNLIMQARPIRRQVPALACLIATCGQRSSFSQSEGRLTSIHIFGRRIVLYRALVKRLTV